MHSIWKRINLRYRYRQLRNYFVDSESLWQDGLPEEISYWEQIINSVGTSDDIYVKHFEKRLYTRNQPLSSKLTQYLDTIEQVPVNILDIGAGPVTQLGTSWDKREIRITAVDPLADDYNRALRKSNLEPEIWTQQGNAESIGQIFPIQSFDVIYSRNALDHSLTLYWLFSKPCPF